MQYLYVGKINSAPVNGDKRQKNAFEVIKQIRKPIQASVYRRHEKLKKCIDSMILK